MIRRSLFLAAMVAAAGCAADVAYAREVCYSGQCLMQIRSRTYLDGTCLVRIEDYGVQFAGSSKYFGRLVIDGDDVEGFWNGEDAESHAQDGLGTMKQSGECWLGEEAKICIDRKVPKACGK